MGQLSQKRSRGGRLSTELTTAVNERQNGVVVPMKKRTPAPDSHNPVNGDPEAPEWKEEYDDLVLCNLYVNSGLLEQPR